jgi:hypothetical protein
MNLPFNAFKENTYAEKRTNIYKLNPRVPKIVVGHSNGNEVFPSASPVFVYRAVANHRCGHCDNAMFCKMRADDNKHFLCQCPQAYMPKCAYRDAIQESDLNLAQRYGRWNRLCPLCIDRVEAINKSSTSGKFEITSHW